MLSWALSSPERWRGHDLAVRAGGGLEGRLFFDPREVTMSDAENQLIMTLDTGPVTIQLRPDLAPGHVERIKELTREGFYDGVVFHRVIPGFMAQGGDPAGTGMGGSKKANLKAEFSDEPHIRGVCSMARSSNPNSANSQFFICFDDATFLEG